MTKSKSNTAVPVFRSGKESRRFVRNLIWILVLCSLAMTGQGLRYYFNYSQLIQIRNETEKLYKSVLGPDIGGSPFGRLQFEQGKLMAARRVGLDPLSVLAALSRPEAQSLKLDGLSLTGMSGMARGVMGAGQEAFDAYFSSLSDDDQYLFRLNRSEEGPDGVVFSLIVEPR
ncbi:hypothetical protein [Pseudodesulfovibrio sediminis]|uniref:Fimbrial assembly family protein n=1 Tax=Pseudodesulfovibrio sediminis TaxID=2810563 RepID=A0ABM7P7V6_9BACT|nr:hypothetical protein [Pseudodesulfovibrio sediminis]BCS89052.1 hypothetical protein PSDVSF_22940 [Pseudodesulfovibrio sediminis]